MPPDTQEAWAQVQDAGEELEDLRQEFKEVNKVYSSYLEKLHRENGILPQPGNPHFIYDDPAARRKFAAARQKNEDMLKELEVAGLRDIQSKMYYDTLKGNGTLRELHCPDCYLYDRSGYEAAETLRHNTTLTVLNLENNSISTGGCCAIAGALTHHPTLTHLRLSGNVCGSQVGTAMGHMLLTNSSITKLDVAHCSFSNSGAAVFSEALQANRTLLSLDLSGNLITQEMGLRLVSTLIRLRGESPLTQLVLLQNDIDPAAQLTIQNLLGGEWKCKNSVAGIGMRKRALPHTAAAIAALTRKQVASIESAFHYFDEDDSGDVDAQELFKAVEMLEIEISLDEIEDMIKAVDNDGSGSIDLDEFTGIMAVMFAMNKQEEADDSDDEVIDYRSGEEIVAELMFASGLYDPCHVFPEAMR
ncbi:hypothetical protein T484DRAFT_3102794 [Baffinella frigidus]|nr:hypothetical protein T484DRAFT_3102794 [Cryptophyta sp. CCMP2293]